jgi:hypothetical protein
MRRPQHDREPDWGEVMATPCFQHDSYQPSCADCRDMNGDDEPAMTKRIWRATKVGPVDVTPVTFAMGASPKDLLALAVRCEQATGPDQQLDTDIRRAWKTDAAPSNFTHSLDAAMTLVPEGADKRATVAANGQSLVYVGGGRGCASTEALAICAAALKARAAQ